MWKRLGGPVDEAARALLGWTLVSSVEEETAVMIVETEAYGGSDDPASHAARGPTRRNRSMFGPPGTLYVYRSYGVHWCANVATGPAGVGMAVLLRGGIPLAGTETMIARRSRSDHLADGPGKLTQALGITGELDGTSLREGPVRLVPGRLPEGWVVTSGPRVGVSRAVERPWRFLAREVMGSPRA